MLRLVRDNKSQISKVIILNKYASRLCKYHVMIEDGQNYNERHDAQKKILYENVQTGLTALHYKPLV